MRITKAGIFLIFSIIILSVLTAHFLKLISIDFESDDEKLSLSALSSSDFPIINDTRKNLMWFTQVSDLHLSIFQDNDRGLDLLEFCNFTMKYINPSVILATGDLTDAKKRDMIGSQQFEEEWIKYKDILDKCLVAKSVPWLDIRGNHDNFDVPSILSQRNFFRNYSMQGKRHSRSYIHKLAVGLEKFAFIGIDACPAVGLKRPFNFIGLLPDSEMEELRRLRDSAKDADYIIWFGHYPTSCILSHEPGVKSLISSAKQSIAYLCGHFHSMLGFVPNMYTLQKGGFYELELADWKETRVYRVAAIDHGLFSFVDVKHKEWPVILVTNPKDALFQSPAREPLAAMRASTHIRILVFSPSRLVSVKLKIDDGPWGQAIPVGGPLFVFPWDTDLYATGVHYLYVSAVDLDARERQIIQPFSLDRTRLEYKIVPRLFLMLSFSSVMQVLYGCAVFSCTFPFCFLRYMNKQILDNKRSLPVMRNKIAHELLRKLWLLSNINILFYPIVLYPLYISIGPWAIAEVLEGEYGVIFIWGIFVNNAFIPGSFTYGYAFLQLFLFHGPLAYFTASSIDRRLRIAKRLFYSRSKIMKVMTTTGGEIPYILLLLTQLLMAYAFYLAYGLVAVLTGPIRFWPIALVLWLWYQSRYLPLHKIKEAAKVWERNVSSTSS